MKIRPLAIALIVHEDRILVMECFDKVKQEIFYRPLGGGIEFTETGEEALKREFMEEMNAEIKSIKFLKVFENIFTCEGVQGHEIVLLFRAELQNPTLYSQEEIQCNEADVPFLAKWVKLEYFKSHKKILYPGGLTEYLETCYQAVATDQAQST